MNNKILIATAMYNGDFFKDKEILSLDKSAQTQVKTTNQVQMPNIDFEALYENKIVFYSAIVVILLVVILLFKLIFKSKKNKIVASKPSVNTTKIKNDAVSYGDKKDQKAKLNYATPSNLNSCIRMFLERTKHK